MPELPEVETTTRYIKGILKGKKITETIVRQPSLRYKIRDDLPQLLKNRRVMDISRRAKYIIVKLEDGYILIHLGMSGSLNISNDREPIQKHSHCDIIFGKIILRYDDPRRFGCILWTQDPDKNKLLTRLGVEPLSSKFNGKLLYQLSRNKTTPIKQFIMDGRNIVGVGNIYASESLWQARILPTKAAGECTREESDLLVVAIKKTLHLAIKAGGTTLRDFHSPDGKLGYFVNELNIYGKDKEPCPGCGKPITKIVLCQRASFFCDKCQT